MRTWGPYAWRQTPSRGRTQFTLRKRHLDCEGAAAVIVAHAHVAARGTRQPAGQREPEPGALRAAAGLPAGARLEDPVALVRVDARAVVGDGDHRTGAVPAELDAHGRLPVADGIVEHRLDDALEQVGLDGDDERGV